MLVGISPAKKLDLSETPDLATTEPIFPQETAALTAEVRKLGVDDLRKLMGISEDLAKLNHVRFQSFSDAPAPEDLRPAAFVFAGDTYVGLEAARSIPMRCAGLRTIGASSRAFADCCARSIGFSPIGLKWAAG